MICIPRESLASVCCGGVVFVVRLGVEIFTDVRNVQMKVESYVLSRCMVNSSMLFELYDAFQQRQNVINKFLEFSDNTATLRNLSRNEIVHQINLLIKKRRI